ncbi:hypothetical protein BN1723_008360 [Verticillium longisporum]|uniref:Serine hydrolase domain-containing protein n=1 Tax=Verticillium longisporum TaxID=100787 RepID=A0A0G4NRD9_VERLO|nr:hypothetical protein BN1708_004279 [Verticillium longisporum]CRK49068.1 hypothetical protein BN1723_008360 [Verticillium longisporum]
MRILCLHGMGTNSKPQVFQMQTTALRHQLGHPQAHHFEFIDGGEPCDLAPGIETFISAEEALAYYDPKSAPSILAAIDDLSYWLAENGPFDGVMGFSQGASLAAMVMARARFANPPLFSFGVFFCAGLPYCEDSLRAGEAKFLRAADGVGPVIHVPTAHIVGREDPDVAHGTGLAELCQEWGRVLLDHGAGHEIPLAPVEVTKNMASVVAQVMRKSTFGQ